jgi:hypothetical protein
MDEGEGFTITNSTGTIMGSTAGLKAQRLEIHLLS